MGAHRFKEIRERPPETSTGWCRSIRSATIEVLHNRPHLVPVLWQSPLIVMQLSEGTVSALHG
jgi:hypothetical protein